jgi:hypothetical protein
VFSLYWTTGNQATFDKSRMWKRIVSGRPLKVGLVVLGLGEFSVAVTEK